jgi:hypothetical protein
MPVRLADDADAEALRFEQPADQRHAEAGMVDVGVAGDEDDVALVPAQRASISARDMGRKGETPKRLGPVLAVGGEASLRAWAD